MYFAERREIFRSQQLALIEQHSGACASISVVAAEDSGSGVLLQSRYTNAWAYRTVVWVGHRIQPLVLSAYHDSVQHHLYGSSRSLTLHQQDGLLQKDSLKKMGSLSSYNSLRGEVSLACPLSTVLFE